jgi:hypothetical protein
MMLERPIFSNQQDQMMPLYSAIYVRASAWIVIGQGGRDRSGRDDVVDDDGNDDDGNGNDDAVGMFGRLVWYSLEVLLGCSFKIPAGGLGRPMIGQSLLLLYNYVEICFAAIPCCCCRCFCVAGTSACHTSAPVPFGSLALSAVLAVVVGGGRQRSR